MTTELNESWRNVTVLSFEGVGREEEGKENNYESFIAPCPTPQVLLSMPMRGDMAEFFCCREFGSSRVAAEPGPARHARPRLKFFV